MFIKFYQEIEMVEEWNLDRVGEWMEASGFAEYTELFCTQHKIDGISLLSLTEQDLKAAPIEMKVLGDIKRISRAIENLKSGDFEPDTYLGALVENNTGKVRNILYTNPGDDTSGLVFPFPFSLLRNWRIRQVKPNANKQAIDNDVLSYSKLQEWLRVLVGLSYLFFAIFLTSITMTIVHDRVPDTRKYPPLPDIFLDNIPLIPVAFQAAELCGVSLAVILMTLLFFHKYRLIILRRVFSILGSLFILRCCTMFVTSLSVPGSHLNCTAQQYPSWETKLYRSYEIFSGGGMVISGVKTCGDYMFSGHTTVITTLNLFITEYTAKDMHLISTLGWILNMFGIFFVLAAHEHYSIDVLIAFYITTRLFISYHSFANSRASVPRIWFPMFSYLERYTTGQISNIYEFPVKIPLWVKSICIEILNL